MERGKEEKKNRSKGCIKKNSQLSTKERTKGITKDRADANQKVCKRKIGMEWNAMLFIFLLKVVDRCRVSSFTSIVGCN
jgi:hypothetical protein